MVVPTLKRLLRWIWDCLRRWFWKRTGTAITLDTGKRVILGKQIAEGGFSYVFEAFDDDTSSPSARRNYAILIFYKTAVEKSKCIGLSNTPI
jgi:hypothetical protein